MTNERTIISSGVDWITSTEVQGAGVDDLMAIAFDIKQANFPNDIIEKPWSAMGYSGKTYGPMSIGTRGDSEAIMIISGDLARIVYPGIPLNWERVTRIDLQTTVALEKPDDRKAIRHYETQRDLQRERKDGKMWSLISSATGDTLYYGKRSHSRYYRFYDKSVDYGMTELGHAWRYEVEYKKDIAKRMAKTVAHMDDPYSEIASVIWGEFDSVNFPPIYNRGDKVNAMEVGVKLKTAEGQLRWLEKCVSPVVGQLMLLGYEDEVLNSLKLQGLARKVNEKDVIR